MGRFIPKEQVAGFQRWQVSAFDKPPNSAQVSTPTAPEPAPVGEPPTSHLAVEEIPFPTAEEVDRICEQAREEGFRTGHAEGFAAGEADANAKCADQLAQVSALVGNLQVSLAHLDQEIADQLLDLSLEVAAQLFRSSLNVQRELLLPTIREAIAELPYHHGTVTIHLNPEDAAALHDLLKEQLAHTGAHFVADASVSAGGCHIRAGSSEIDATIETRWRRVLESIGASPQEWLNRP